MSYITPRFRSLLCLCILALLVAAIPLHAEGKLGGWGKEAPDKPAQPDKPTQPDKPDESDEPDRRDKRDKRDKRDRRDKDRPVASTPTPRPEAKLDYPASLQTFADAYHKAVKPLEEDVQKTQEAAQQNIQSTKEKELEKLRQALLVEAKRLKKEGKEAMGNLCVKLSNRSLNAPEWSKAHNKAIRGRAQILARIETVRKLEQAKVDAQLRKLEQLKKTKGAPVTREFDKLIAAATKANDPATAQAWKEEKEAFFLPQPLADEASPNATLTVINNNLSIGPVYQSECFPAKTVKATMDIKPVHQTIQLTDTTTWTQSTVRHGIVNHLKMPKNSIQFFAFELHANKTKGDVQLRLGSDDSIVVFINANGVFRKETSREVAANQDSTKVALQQGKNIVVIKLHNGGATSGVYFKFGPNNK